MRQLLPYTEGFWWKRKSDNVCVRNAFLADWDSQDNYEQITDAEKEQMDKDNEELSDTEALNLIMNGDETE